MGLNKIASICVLAAALSGCGGKNGVEQPENKTVKSSMTVYDSGEWGLVGVLHNRGLLAMHLPDDSVFDYVFDFDCDGNVDAFRLRNSKHIYYSREDNPGVFKLADKIVRSYLFQ